MEEANVAAPPEETQDKPVEAEQEAPAPEEDRPLTEQIAKLEACLARGTKESPWLTGLLICGAVCWPYGLALKTYFEYHALGSILMLLGIVDIGYATWRQGKNIRENQEERVNTYRVRGDVLLAKYNALVEDYNDLINKHNNFLTTLAEAMKKKA